MAAVRVNLDAMIPRADFALQAGEVPVQQIADFRIEYLSLEAPIRRQLRKPDFQRETNHWSPEQIATFVGSFLDTEVVPSVILWKSTAFIFVIDGAHRLSALRAWMEDDYGDGTISQAFYSGIIPPAQRRIAARTRALVEDRIGRYSTLKNLVGAPVASNPIQAKRAGNLFVRPLQLQWVYGDASVAESSFSKINSQGTPLDETEAMLINNRRKPIAISARAIIRAGTGNRYWSSFEDHERTLIETHAGNLFRVLFEPDMLDPLRTLDIPLGGSVSPIDALGLLIEFLTIAGSATNQVKTISAYQDDTNGQETIDLLTRSYNITKRITGNSPESLGLHPIVYFYNERGKHSRFLFLGMTMLIAERVRNNDSGFFRKFTLARQVIEAFLIEYKSLVSILLQNWSKAQRVTKVRDLFSYLVSQHTSGKEITPEAAIAFLGVRGRVFDVNPAQTATHFSDTTKSALFVKTAISSALKCPICHGLLDPAKSVSYDHVQAVRDAGLGSIENGQLVHPYCNSARESLAA